MVAAGALLPVAAAEAPAAVPEGLRVLMVYTIVVEETMVTGLTVVTVVSERGRDVTLVMTLVVVMTGTKVSTTVMSVVESLLRVVVSEAKFVSTGVTTVAMGLNSVATGVA